MPGPIARRPLIVLSALAAFACSDGEAPQSPSSTELSNIELAVRIHLLQSSELEALNSTLTDAEVDALTAAVNKVWEQARITWRLESVVREPARNAAGYERMLSGLAPASAELFGSILPSEHFLPGKWDVFVIRDLSDIAGGIYLQSLGAVVFAELGPVGSQAADGPGARILAHELGHSLGLPHVPCTPEGNLMAAGCPSQNRTRLSAEQVELARRQARRGVPFGL